MFDIWIGEVEISSLIIIAAVVLVLPLQLLLCFKVKNLLTRLMPSMLLTATTILLFAMVPTTQDWDAIGYAMLGVLSGVLLFFSGLGWAIWAIVCFVQKRKAANGR